MIKSVNYEMTWAVEMVGCLRSFCENSDDDVSGSQKRSKLPIISADVWAVA